MHDQTGLPGGRRKDDAVLRAHEQFNDAIDLLVLVKGRLRRGEIDGVRDVAPHVALVIKTLLALNEAKGRIDDLAGNGEGAALDLDAARAEVRSRLDRLRAAEDP